MVKPLQMSPWNRPSSPYGQAGLATGGTWLFRVDPQEMPHAGRVSLDLFGGGGIPIDPQWLLEGRLALRAFWQKAPNLDPAPFRRGLPRTGWGFGLSGEVFVGRALARRLQMGPLVVLSAFVSPSVSQTSSESTFNRGFHFFALGPSLRIFLSRAVFLQPSLVCGLELHAKQRGSPAVDGFCDFKLAGGVAF